MNQLLSKALDELQARMFYMNKKSDRIANLLKHKFGCIAFSELFHNDYAHFWALKAADRIVEIKDLDGEQSEYPAVEESREDFETLQDMFSFLFSAVVETKESVQEAIEIAEQEKEVCTKVALEDFISKLQKVCYSTEFLFKKSTIYGNELYNFDAQASVWYVKIFDAM